MWVEVDSEELHSVYVQRSYVLHGRQEYEEQLAYNPVLRILWILSDEVRCSNGCIHHSTHVLRGIHLLLRIPVVVYLQALRCISLICNVMCNVCTRNATSSECMHVLR